MTPTPNPANTSPRQYGATIVKKIAVDRVAALKTFLQSIGDNIVDNPHIPFTQLPSVHFMSWFVVEAKDYDPFLYLELNVDGPIEPFVKVLVAKAHAGIDLIYAHCIGYPPEGSSSPASVVRYLLADDIGYDCYYIGWRGLTVERILQERDLCAQLEGLLDQTGDSVLASMQPSAIRTMIQDFVTKEPALAWAKTFPPRPFLVRYRDQVFMALKALGVLAVLVVFGLGFLVWRYFGPWPVVAPVVALTALVAGLVGYLRYREATDSVSTAKADHEQVSAVVSRENFFVQNHFASIAYVKPGLFRWLLLKSVLKVTHWVAAIYANQGSLSGITSIHFARWVVIDQGRRLLFLSNYDGSWENYLDDFIDQASGGLTAIWSNTIDFPRSYYLAGGGAKDALLFKTLVRQSQTPSIVWYSAYRDLSIQNIKTNADIREGLFAPMDDAAVKAWLINF